MRMYILQYAKKAASKYVPFKNKIRTIRTLELYELYVANRMSIYDT